MKRIALALSLALLTLPALAQQTQQDRMKACNADAAKKELKGDERRAFMTDCLSAKKDEAGKDAAAAQPETGNKAADGKELTPQQARMKKCNADAAAGNLKGDERRKFMSGCLKNKG
jgi:hypothetical protein